MRIVIDMQGAQASGKLRGIGRYSSELIKAIIRNNTEHEIILVFNSLFLNNFTISELASEYKISEKLIKFWRPLENLHENSDCYEWRWKISEYLRESYLESLSPDIIYVCSLFEGFIDNAITSIKQFDLLTPTIVTIYDFIPFLNKIDYLPEGSIYEKYYLRKLDYLKKADYWCAISDSSAQEALSILEIPKEKIYNISAGHDVIFKVLNLLPEDVTYITNKFSIRTKFILYTGGLDKRKNIGRLIKAFSLLKEDLKKEYQLLIVGKINDSEYEVFKEYIEQCSLSLHEVHFLGYVVDNELVMLYNLCEVFIFPSWHEGFGLPALEAMACGAPVLAANTSSLPEVIGMTDALFDPFSEYSIKNKLEKVLTDKIFRNKLISNGLQQSKKFTWDASSKKVLKIFNSFTSKSINLSRTDLIDKLLHKISFQCIQHNLNDDNIKEISVIINENLGNFESE